MKKIFGLGLVVGLVGCSTLPVSSQDRKELPQERQLAFQAKTDTNSAKIIVTRDAGAVGSACYYGFWVDGILAGRFAPKETAVFYIPEGERVLKSGRDPQGKGLCGLDKKVWNQIESVVDKNTVKSYRMTMDGAGFPMVQREN